MKVISIEEAFAENIDGIFIDVRSEGEYANGHIPGSFNIPLLDNKERAIIGTLYKQQDRETAIKKGLEFFGPKMKYIIEKVENLILQQSRGREDTIIIYCWRGGMRSNIMAWLLSIYGFKIVLINGGYKSFRNWCINIFKTENRYKLIGGYTGTGKTTILHRLFVQFKVPVIDLEGIANHRGSAFGAIGMGVQPSQEMFENLLAFNIWHCLRNNKYVILEDESQRIGMVSIPQEMWEMMKTSSLLFLKMRFENRLKNIIKDYGKLDRSLLSGAIIRLQKRLGGLDTKRSLEYLVNKDIRSCFNILLKYYDKSYLKSLEQKKQFLTSYYEINIDADADDIHKVYDALNKI